MAASVESAEAVELKQKIEDQGTKVRDIKSAGADKALVDQEVQLLLQLKQQYKSLTGVELAPAAGKKDKKSAKKTNEPAAAKQAPKGKQAKSEATANQIELKQPTNTQSAPVSTPLQQVDKADMLRKLAQNSVEAKAKIAGLIDRLAVVRKAAVAPLIEQEQERLQLENAALRVKIDNLKKSLSDMESNRGVRQYPVPQLTIPEVIAPVEAIVAPKAKDKPCNIESKASGASTAPINKKEGEEKTKEKKKAPVKPANNLSAAASSEVVDVSRVDMRIGQIVDVRRHPDANTLYVETVDVGEEKPRTVVSGLVNFVPIEEMANRIAIFTCNLKPAKMRGITSEAMIMCGSSPEKVEIIVPPARAKVGDRVYVEGFEGTPDAQMNPKKKIFEQIQPDLKINGEGVATYKGQVWKVTGCDGLCTVPTMRNSAIK